jgi:hypothetical protein
MREKIKELYRKDAEDAENRREENRKMAKIWSAKIFFSFSCHPFSCHFFVIFAVNFFLSAFLCIPPCFSASLRFFLCALRVFASLR